MRLQTLEEWLQWQTSLHDQAIELGLDRVSQVGRSLGLGKIAGQVITVAGTNGKGSTVAAYETWLHNAGFRVASYTSPHLLQYNERVRNSLEMVDDSTLCAAFAAVEAARDDIALTYFEYGTLAALYLMQQWNPDFALLEVGLGGRLDAVNIIDADLVHLTPIGIDHENWLGDTRDKIGYEKAGVLRPNIPVILNDREPPRSVLNEIDRLQCQCLRIARDYQVTPLLNDWLWQAADYAVRFNPELPGRHQVDNFAGVLAGLSCLVNLEDYSVESVGANFGGIQLAGRFQQIDSAIPASLYIDVGHNQDAARVMTANLTELAPNGRCVVLLGMLSDKRVDLFIETMAEVVDAWWLVGLDGDRGLSATELEARIGEKVFVEQRFMSASDAYSHALSSLGNQDIMLVTGSFVTVENWLRALPDSGESNSYGSKH